MIYTDAQIAELSESAGRLVQANGLYINQLIVTDIRDAYELALTYRDNQLTTFNAEITELRAKVAAQATEIERSKQTIASMYVELRARAAEIERLTKELRACQKRSAVYEAYTYGFTVPSLDELDGEFGHDDEDTDVPQ